MPPYFDLPVNLPHAGKIAWRMQELIILKERHTGESYRTAADLCVKLLGLLDEYRVFGTDPDPSEEKPIVEECAAIARELVEATEGTALAGNRMGQCVRNFFECLGLGEEGAAISLRAGEDPNSLQRPV